MNAVLHGDFIPWSILPIVVLVMSFLVWNLILRKIKKESPDRHERLVNIGFTIATVSTVVLLAVFIYMN
ncbi:hypothetical protein [Silanimonas sp.]|uniref:hypothetical protein n=1 Tax=Silanimonas sp. TaxID=1929290 RepID=UPI001BBA4B44|nr:hypothetical protein [Silanimonas sp.]MBS3895935.1 hypothetical protein [Silanimonas sp.]